MAAERLRILILEDVPMDAELVEYELQRASIPFDARCVDTRDEFLRELDDFRPDLILSDYSLPRFDGMAALSLARERAPTVPFLIVTGSVNEETAVGCMKAGATDYLLKSNLARIGPAIEAALARVEAQAEKARAKAALRRSEANLRAIYNTSRQAFVLVDGDGTILALNPTAEAWAARTLGRRAGEGDHIHDFIPDAAESFRAALGGDARTVERCLRGTDGVERWYETTHAPVVDERGAVIGVCLNARDVSERKRAEQAGRESEARYRDLFDNASDLVCTTALDGTVLYANPAWCEAMGHPDDASRRFADLVHPDSRDRYFDVVARAEAGEKVGHVDLVLVTAAGVPLTLEGNLSCTTTGGGPARLRGIYRDVTERKRVEDQLRRAERMEAAGRLAGGVAHEVNNMMTGVIGFSEFLLRGLEVDDPRRDEVREIIKAGTRAADITRQLLAFTRQQMLRPEVLPVNAVVRGLELMLRRSLGEDHRLQLALTADAGEIHADRGQLEQVLVNLVLNARDAMAAPGCVTMSTGVAALDESYVQQHGGIRIPVGEYVQLAVSDTGAGMDRETQARIFEPFFTTKPVGQGTGLGLSTVYGIVKQSEGFIWVYSEPGHGTTFKVYLPRVGTGIDLPGDDGGGHPRAAEGGSETVLIVEDEAMVRALASRGLREHGYTVLEARHGADALRQLQSRPSGVHLVITDVVMPEMGGRELGRRLKALRPSLPVLFMSGYTGEDVIQRGLMDRDAPFQQKPFAPDGLARKVREMLDEARARLQGA